MDFFEKIVNAKTYDWQGFEYASEVAQAEKVMIKLQAIILRCIRMNRANNLFFLKYFNWNILMGNVRKVAVSLLYIKY